jgi:ABC-type glycerol-3-phosphate transport system substrate-binding protein
MKPNTVTRRTFLKAAALSSGALALAACAAPPAPSAPAATASGETTAPAEAPAAAGANKVTLWGWWAARMKLFETAAADFSQANPDTAITVEVFDDEFWNKLFAALSANTAPTLAKMQTTNYFKLRQQEQLLPLDEATLPSGELKRIYPNHAWDTYGYFVAPEGNQTAILTYNKAMFTEAGLDPDKPPATWDEFFAAAEKLTQRDGQTLKVAGFQYDDWLPALNPLYQQGSNVIKRDGETVTATFDTPEMERALNFFVELAEKRQAFDPAFPYFTDAIGNKQAAMSINEAWGHGEWKSNFPDTFKELGFAAPPTPTGQAEPLYGRQNSVLSLSALKGRPADETNAGMRFISYLINDRKDTQYELATISGLVPAHVDLLSDPKVTGDPFTNLAATLVQKQYDAGELSSGFTTLMGDAMTKLLTEKAPVADVLKFGQDGLAKLIADGELGLLR